MKNGLKVNHVDEVYYAIFTREIKILNIMEKLNLFISIYIFRQEIG